MTIEFNDIAQIVQKILGNSPSDTLPETTVQSLAMDSLDVLEVTMAIEESFGKEIDPAAFAECATLEDVRQLVESHA